MSGESPSFRKCSNPISIGIDEITSRKRAICRYFTRQISNIKERNSSLMNHSALSKVDRVKMVLGHCLAYGIVRRREAIHKVKRFREISPQSLFLKRTETEWRLATAVRAFSSGRKPGRPKSLPTVGDAQA